MNRDSMAAKVVAAAAVLSVSAIVWVGLLRPGTDGTSGAGAYLVAVLLVGIVIGLVWWRGLRAAAGARTVADARPGWRTHQTWADASLADQLAVQGIWEKRMKQAGGTRLTMAWSAGGLELWRGARAPRTVLSVPWAHVASVSVGSGNAASTARPAVAVTTVAGACLILVPARTPGGALLPAPPAVVADLVATLRTARDAATSALRDPAGS